MVIGRLGPRGHIAMCFVGKVSKPDQGVVIIHLQKENTEDPVMDKTHKRKCAVLDRVRKV